VARNNLGIAFFSQGLRDDDPEMVKKAVQAFEAAAALDPVYASPWNGLGIAHRQLGDLDRAAAALEKAVELNPEYGMARYNLGMVYLDRGQKSQALAQFLWYQDTYRNALPPGESDKLEALIKQCQK
jgi:superkiller protein 3